MHGRLQYQTQQRNAASQEDRHPKHIGSKGFVDKHQVAQKKRYSPETETRPGSRHDVVKLCSRRSSREYLSEVPLDSLGIRVVSAQEGSD